MALNPAPGLAAFLFVAWGWCLLAPGTQRTHFSAHSEAQVEWAEGRMYGNYGNQITWSHQRVSPGGKGSAAGGEKGVAGMGQCLRYQIHWEDLEEYQVGSSG